MDCSLPASSIHGDSSKDTGAGCHALLQGDLPNPGIQPVSLLSPPLAGGFFTTSTIWETQTHPFPSQTGIKPYTNDLLSQFLLPDASGVVFNRKLQGMLKDKRNNLKRKEVSEPDSGTLYTFWNYQIKNLITMTNMLRTAIEKIDNMQEQMSIVKWRDEISKKEKEILETKCTVMEMKECL